MADPTPGDRERSILGGRLLGTQPVADAVKSFGGEITKFTKVLAEVSKTVTGQQRQMQGGNRGAGGFAGNAWNAASHWGGWGSQNGGGFRINGAASGLGLQNAGLTGLGTVGMPGSKESHNIHTGAAIAGNRSQPFGGTAGNGGLPYARTAIAVSMGGAAVAGGLGGLTAWGDRNYDDMTKRDMLATRAYNNGGYSSIMAAQSRLAMGNATGFGVGDQVRAQMMSQSQGGINGGLGRNRPDLLYSGMLNPLQSNVQGAQVQQNLTMAPRVNQLQMFGISALSGMGNQRGTADINDQILTRLGAAGPMSVKQRMATFRDQNSRLNQTMRSWGFDADMMESVQNQGAAQARIQQQGGDVGRFRGLLTTGGGTGKTARAARDTLRDEFNYKMTIADENKQLDATNADRNADTLKGFRDGVRQSTEALSGLSDAARKLMQITGTAGPVGQAGSFLGQIGSGFGVGAVAGGASHMLGGMLAWRGAKRMLGGPRGAASGAGVGRAAGAAKTGAMGLSRFSMGLAGAFGMSQDQAGMNADGSSSLAGNWVPGMDMTPAQARAGKAAYDKERESRSGWQKASDLFFGSGGSTDDKQTSKKGGAGGAAVKLMWPVKGKITSPFGPRTHPVTGRRGTHTGIDISASNGTPIMAAADGTVSKAGSDSIYGNQTVIQHQNGLATMYGHQSSISVKSGQSVRQGQRIGAVGSTGLSTGNHLHLEVWRGGTPVNPMPYLGGGGMAGPAGSNMMAGVTSDAASGASSGASGLGSAPSLALGAYGSVNEADAIAAALASGSPISSSGQSSDNGASGDNVGRGTGRSLSGLGTGSGKYRSVLSQAGFSGASLAMASRILMAESGGNARAYNGRGPDNSYGLFQINMIGAMGPARRKQFGLSSNDDLFDPLTNAKAAYAISNGGKNWSPWSTYTNGAYKKYAKGAFNIEADQNATVHKGEMIIPERQADEIRRSLLKASTPQTGGGGGVRVEFGPNSIVFKGQVGKDVDARKFAKQIVDMISEDDRLEKMGAGR